MSTTSSLPAPAKPASPWRQYWALTKPRVVQLIVFCAVIGMLLAEPGVPRLAVAVPAAVGIWLVASAAAAFNCLVEQAIGDLVAQLGAHCFNAGAQRINGGLAVCGADGLAQALHQRGARVHPLRLQAAKVANHEINVGNGALCGLAHAAREHVKITACTADGFAQARIQSLLQALGVFLRVAQSLACAHLEFSKVHILERARPGVMKLGGSYLALRYQAV